MTYDVVHTTHYEYSESVSVSHHVARLSPAPAAAPGRACTTSCTIDAGAGGDQDPRRLLRQHHDVLHDGGRAHGAHRARPEHGRREAEHACRRPADTPPWEAASGPRPALRSRRSSACSTRRRFRRATESRRLRAAVVPARAGPLLEAVADLTRRIHEDFTFDPEATTVATPLGDVFRSRRGVCQDFARLEIACLRSLGLPARYVSGYLETVPPPGTPRLVGADASHAWLAVYCPGAGWIDVDPTNNLLPSTTHVTLAWGRDYGDVSPIRGVILGGGDHSLRVNVEVTRVATS